MGVVHGDELQYIFADIWGEDLSMSPSDTKFSTVTQPVPFGSNCATTLCKIPSLAHSSTRT